MKNSGYYILAWCAVLALAVALRLPNLQRRPMHTDEAVHAVKLGDLLETGTYRYDANEYHGPTLNLFTLIPAALRGQTRLAELDETTLRLIPVFFGLALILLLALLARVVGRTATLASAIWVAVSPVQVFYSRYYIQEMLFLFFSVLLLIAIFRYGRSAHWGWVLTAGCALGLLHATKETDILIIATMMMAAAVVWLEHRQRSDVAFWPRRHLSWHLLVFFLSALLVSGLFYTVFLTHPQGFLDSFRTYQGYFQRGIGQSLHLHSLYYYFKLLFFFHLPGKPVWSEAWLPPFALLAVARIFRRPTERGEDKAIVFKKWLIFYTLALGIIYSVIPYKTPWNILSFQFGLLLLAGIGSIDLLEMLKKKRWIAILIGVICFTGMIRQAVLLNGRYDSDPGNPWVYAHPGPDVRVISERVEAAARAAPEGVQSHVQVIVPGHEYWPLPWTLRQLPNAGWYERVDDQSPVAPIILVTPDEEPALSRKLYLLPPPGQKHLYMRLWQEYLELRPGKEIRGYVRKDVWDLLQDSKK
ncbi:TIGR03663 family protein [candidate division KSB1 bacterium]|nr:TIGR03663 family protein [candidate division KSB1 bacterium]